jgi:hypothetical protein
MIGKVCLAGALALALSSPVETQTTPPTFVANPYIKMIRCTLVEDGEAHAVSGSGFKLKDGRWVSVNHVTTNDNCTVDGQPITVTYADPNGDISIFSVDLGLRGGLEIDCGGYRDHLWYHGQGFADGLPIVRSVPVMDYEQLREMAIDRGWGVLAYNRFIPGMSGGPVLDSISGKVVGTVNAFSPFFPISFSRELKETVLCQPS